MKKICFGDADWKSAVVHAYSFRFTETPEFTQCADHITTAVNREHPQGFDNISLLLPQTYTAGMKAKLRCSFDGLGCPEIILVEKIENCSDGAVRYGACFEIVLYEKGVNVWRHYMDEADHRCFWHKRLGVLTPVAEKEIQELEVEIAENRILFSINGVGAELRTEDLFERFYLGVSACEGIVRLYDLQIDQNS